MKQKVFNLIILDASGSMSSIKNEAIGAVNETIQTIRNSKKKNEEHEHFFSLVVFNSNEVRIVYDCVEADKIEELTSDQYIPSSLTPLYDAMGNALTDLQKKVSDKDNVLVTIVTDGYENASREYNSTSINALVESLKKKKWLFAYIGANQDANKVGHSLGIGSTLNFQATPKGTVAMGVVRSSMIKRVSNYFCSFEDDCSLEDDDLFDDSLDSNN